MDREDVLILSNNMDVVFPNNNGRITDIYRKKDAGKLERIIRKIFFKYRIPMHSFFLGRWYKQLDYFRTVIIFDTGNAPYLIDLIKKKEPQIRIILWYWNAVEKSIPICSINRNNCEIWSYRKADCTKYNLKENTQFFIPDKLEQDRELKQDVYFVGADKNRSEILYDLSKVFCKNNITYKYILTKYKKSIETKIPYSSNISVCESRENMLESRVILDIVDETQMSGITLRPLEAISNGKKVITNDKGVEYLQIYNRHNFFIIGKDSFDEIKSFIDTPFDSTNSSNIDYYTFDAWRKRFFG